MHDRGPQLPEARDEPRVVPMQMSGTFLERCIVHIVAFDAAPELVRDLRQGEDGVAPAVLRETVDEVHDAVLEAAHREAMHDVDDERASVVKLRAHGCPRAA